MYNMSCVNIYLIYSMKNYTLIMVQYINITLDTINITITEKKKIVNVV